MINNLINALNNRQNIIPVIGFEMLPIKDSQGNYVAYLDYMSKIIANDNQLILDPKLAGFKQFSNIVHQLFEKT